MFNRFITGFCALSIVVLTFGLFGVVAYLICLTNYGTWILGGIGYLLLSYLIGYALYDENKKGDKNEDSIH